MTTQFTPMIDLARKLIAEQFPQYSDLSVVGAEKQGHDNRTYRLGDDILVRMPTAQAYGLKVPKEQKLLPQLARYFTIPISVSIKMGKASEEYPYLFSISKWLTGKSINLLTLTEPEKAQVALDCARFLKELQAITEVEELRPGQHNFWRGDHVRFYDQGARQKILALRGIIEHTCALDLWERACLTEWNKPPVWVHGDFAIGNLLVHDDKLSDVIDFGGVAVGDTACDLVIAWTYFSGRDRDIFMQEMNRGMNLDADTWLRARAWVLWKATFELFQINDIVILEFILQNKIIDEVLSGKY